MRTAVRIIPAHALAQSLFLCRAGMYSSTCVEACGKIVLGFPFFLRFSTTPGSERCVPGRASPRSPLAELVIGARSFADATEG